MTLRGGITVSRLKAGKYYFGSEQYAHFAPLKEPENTRWFAAQVRAIQAMTGKGPRRRGRTNGHA